MHNRIELKILICIKKPDGYIVLIESEIEEIFCDAIHQIILQVLYILCIFG